jgi:hypothetical protein
MKDVEKNQDSGAKKKEQDLTYLRGYCRVCNRHYFYRNNLDTGRNYACATINSKKRL